jgi:hypothetical protein
MSNPKPARRTDLRLSDITDVVAEIKYLSRGCLSAGNWSLEQICEHLHLALQMRMKPGKYPPNTPEQDATRSMLESILKSKKLPDGLPVLATLNPGPTANRQSIDRCFPSLLAFNSSTDAIAPHPRFGHLSQADARQLNLIHCAHHLSFLVPNPA